MVIDILLKSISIPPIYETSRYDWESLHYAGLDERSQCQESLIFCVGVCWQRIILKKAVPVGTTQVVSSYPTGICQLTVM